MSKSPPNSGAVPIAVVGISCRFPGAGNPDAFWKLLREGRDAISAVPKERWDADAVDGDLAQSREAGGGNAHGKSHGTKASTRWAGLLGEIDRFDAAFFGIGAEEARAMDPQQRLMLEVAWEAMEDAGIAPQTLAGGDTGVFIGLANYSYGAMMHMQPHAIGRHANTGASGSIAANRISYFFDFHGPSLAVDSACASSLLAVHLACRSLEAGECGSAIVGGVNVILTPGPSISLARAGMLSADGRSRVYDAAASGWTRGEGAGAVLLKTLERALTDGDAIYAVIRGSAVTQNGRSNGLTGPNRWAQEAALRKAYQRANISPGDVQYIEGHSSGTLIGDATELAALAAVLPENRQAGRLCAVGAVKSNIGHLEAASGIAGLIKTVLMLKHARIAPTLHYEKPSPHVALDRMPLRIATQLSPWPGDGAGRIAGVSAAGFGGANVHVVVSEAPSVPAGRFADARQEYLLALSGRTPEALRDIAARYAAWAEAHPDFSMADLCRTVNLGRARMPHRLAIVAADSDELRRRLGCFAAVDSAAGIYTGKVARAGANAAHSRPDSRQTPESTGAAALSLAELAQAFVSQPDVDLSAVCGQGHRLHGLPTYPFQRQRYWMDVAVPAPSEVAADKTVAIAGHGAAASAKTEKSLPVSGMRPANLDPPLPPRNELERQLAAIWEQVIGVSPIGVRDSFFDLGATSAMALQVFARLEEELEIVLPLASLYSAPTIEQLGELAAAPDQSLLWDPMVALNSGGKRPPMFVVPGLGGHGFELAAFAGDLGKEQPVYVLHPQGLDPRQVPLTSIEKIAEAFVRNVREAQPHGPYRLLGYSFGGSVAYEMACRLREQGEAIALLALIDAYTPGAFREKSLPRRAMAHVRRMWHYDGHRRREYLADGIARLWRRVHAKARGGDYAGGSSVARAVNRVVEANTQAWKNYVPRPYDGSVVLFRAHQLEETIRLFYVCEPTNGWRKFARGGVDIVEMPFDHIEIFDKKPLAFMAEELGRRLNAGGGDRPTQGISAATHAISPDAISQTNRDFGVEPASPPEDGRSAALPITD